jgi:potassium-transporting ATPase KdpC subunit
MAKQIVRQAKIALELLIIFTLLTGFIYPYLVTLIAQLAFPWRANGSLIEHNGQTTGSSLIGQGFTEPKYFWGRPSATLPFPYNAENSSASNLGPSNPQLLENIKQRIAILKHADPKNTRLIPVDLVTTSASGLDPHISPAAAYYQVPRIAKARHISENSVNTLIQLTTQKRGIFNSAYLNVLQLNLALDNLTS